MQVNKGSDEVLKKGQSSTAVPMRTADGFKLQLVTVGNTQAAIKIKAKTRSTAKDLKLFLWPHTHAQSLRGKSSLFNGCVSEQERESGILNLPQRFIPLFKQRERERERDKALMLK